MFKRLSRDLCLVLLAISGITTVTGQAQKSGDAMVYESHNQIDPKPLKVSDVQGTAMAENGSVVPGMQLGLFAEKDHSLVAKAETGQNGEFRFTRIPAGRYRLVAKNPAYCTANVPIIVELSGHGHSGKTLELHMKVGGIDICSFGTLSVASTHRDD
jgi:hypothetical protein